MNRKNTFFLTAGLLAGAVLAVLIYKVTDIPLLRQITPLFSLFISAFVIIRAFRKNEK